MPYYYRIGRFPTPERQRTVDNLLALRKQLDQEIPGKDAEDNLLLATWNIRDFGKSVGRKHGPRLREAHYYIAEIISRFDFVAVQEVNDLPEWHKVMGILGSNWDFIATDVTDYNLGGNGERLTFVFDKRKVWFRNIAGEIVLPAHMLISKVEIDSSAHESAAKLVAGKQLRRSPFIASFQSGWFYFDICTVHIYYGADSGAKLQERIEEIKQVARYMGARADEALKAGKALILLGDFNIVHPEHKTMEALTSEGFEVPKALMQSTNIDRTKYYDQIAFKCQPDVIEYVEQESDDPKQRNAGVFEIFKSILTSDHFDNYAEFARMTTQGKKAQGDAELRDYYIGEWRTYQLSDHNPLWVRLKTDDSEAYLDRMRGDGQRGGVVLLPDAPASDVHS